MKKDWMIKESELDDDQLLVINTILEKSCIVSGCAGSGKSVLALHKAKRIQDKLGSDYQVIVYTIALCDYMNTGRTQLGLSNDFQYYKEWRWKREEKHYSDGQRRKVYQRDANGNMIPNMPKSLCLIVDEVQDFKENEVREFIAATKKNFFFFGDTAQSLYDQTLPVNRIRDLIPPGHPYKEFELFRNHRLPIPVARIAHEVGGDGEEFIEEIYKSPETAIPRFIKYNTPEDQVAAVRRIIQQNGMTDVAILLQDNASVMRAYKMLCAQGQDCELKYSDKDDFRNNQDNLDFDSTNPKVMTFHSAKGLQFETVFIIFAEGYAERRDTDRRSLYVALTRTSRNLYVLYSGQLPDPLSNERLKPLYKEEETDEFEEI